ADRRHGLGRERDAHVGDHARLTRSEGTPRSLQMVRASRGNRVVEHGGDFLPDLAGELRGLGPELRLLCAELSLVRAEHPLRAAELTLPLAEIALLAAPPPLRAAELTLTLADIAVLAPQAPHLVLEIARVAPMLVRARDLLGD